MNKLIEALVDSWDVMTAAPSAHYVASDGKPHGQCAVTALVVQDRLGGVILRGVTAHGSHYWNLIPGVGEIDLTREQYDADLEISRGTEVGRDRLLEGERAVVANTAERYALLASRVADLI